MTDLPVDGFAVLNLDPNHEGSCPCARFKFNGHKYEAHCWRVCSRCRGVGLHYFDASKGEAEQLAALLTEMDWYGEWPVIQGPQR